MKKFLPVVILTITLSACASYEVGDTSRSVYELRERYCQEASPILRYFLRREITKRLESYPEDGLCTDFYARILDENRVSE